MIKVDGESESFVWQFVPRNESSTSYRIMHCRYVTLFPHTIYCEIVIINNGIVNNNKVCNYSAVCKLLVRFVKQSVNVFVLCTVYEVNRSLTA